MLKLHQIILASALLAFAPSPLWAQTKPSVVGQLSQMQATPGQVPRGTDDAPFVVRRSKSPDEVIDDAQARADKTFNDRITIFLSAAVALGTLFQFFALWTIIGTTRHQIRAYVYVASDDLTRQTADGGKYIHHLKAVNTGQTPAKNLRVDSIVKILTHPVPANFDFSLPEDPKNGVWTVGSGKDVMFYAEAERVISETEVAEISNPDSNKRLYSYGTCHYVDIFGQKHTTEFCLYFDVTTVGPDKTVETWVKASQHHNDET
jgi:hypothetical protein